MVANIPQSGYVPGQTIIVSADVTNDSSVPVEKLRFLLRQIITYSTYKPYTKMNTEVVVLQESQSAGVSEMGQGRFQSSLRVPAEPPTMLDLCKVISISYDVEVEAKITGIHLNPYVRLPITIGTIPLYRNVLSDGAEPQKIKTADGFVENVNSGIIKSAPNGGQPIGMVVAIPIVDGTENLSMPPAYPAGPSGSSYYDEQGAAACLYPNMGKISIIIMGCFFKIYNGVIFNYSSAVI